MNEGEQLFADVLTKYGVEFKEQPTIFLNKRSGSDYTTPDFWLPKHDVYCEVINNKQSFYPRIKKISRFIAKGYKFCFYSPNGKRILLTNNTLKRLGLHTNNDLFVLRELPYSECSLVSENIECVSKIYGRGRKTHNRQYIDNACKTPGVRIVGKRFQVYVHIPGKRKYLICGCFDTLLEAEQVYIGAALLHKVKRVTNEVSRKACMIWGI